MGKWHGREGGREGERERTVVFLLVGKPGNKGPLCLRMTMYLVS